MNPSQAERLGASAERAEAGIWQAFARGVRNNILGEISVQVVRIGGMVVLARALAPSDFGLFRVLITITTIVMIINEFGVPDTLVQRRDLRADHESTAAWANLTITMLHRRSALCGRAADCPGDGDAGLAAGVAAVVRPDWRLKGSPRSRRRGSPGAWISPGWRWLR